MTAKRLTILAGVAWCCGVLPAAASVHRSGATARVQARVEPQIVVGDPHAVAIGLHDYRTGSPIPGWVRFHVRANTQQVELQVACTDLCQGGDPASIHKIRVGGSGVQIMGEDGSRLLAWQRDPRTGLLPAGWTGAVSEVGVFNTSAGSVFRQDVTVDLCWQPAGSDLPTGEYCGIVKLIGMVRP